MCALRIRRFLIVSLYGLSCFTCASTAIAQEYLFGDEQSDLKKGYSGKLAIYSTAEDDLSVDLTPTTPSCFGDSDGEVSAQISGGTAPYSYSWSTGSTTNGTNETSNGITGLFSSTYTVTVTDANSATATSTVFLPSAPFLLVDITKNNDISCFEENDGSITANSSGGTGNLTYEWSNGDNGATITGLEAGTYSVTVTDENGCQTASSSVTIARPDELTINSNSTEEASSNSSSDGVINLNVSGGVTPYTVNLSGGSSFPISPIAYQGFESSQSDSWNFAADPASYNTEGDLQVSGSEDVWGIIQEFTGRIDGAIQGDHFWGIQDLRNSNGGRSTFHYLDFDPISISGLTDVVLSFKVYTDGFDSNDDIQYQVKYDNGTDWDAEGIDLDKDSDDWQSIEVEVPDGSEYVRLRIQALQDGSSDYAGVDDISLTSSNILLEGIDPGTYTATVVDANSCSVTSTDLVVGAANTPPTATNVTFTGTLGLGEVLTGDYDYADDENDAEDGTTFQWYRADDENGANIEAIAGETSTTYTLVEDDHGKYLFFEVIPSDGSAQGSAERSSAVYVLYPRINSVSIPQTEVNVDDDVTITIQANQAGLSLQTGTFNGIAVTGFNDEGDGTYTAIYTLKEDHTNRFSNDDIPVSFTLVDDNGVASNTYSNAISQTGDALSVLNISAAPSIAYQDFEDDGDDWDYTEASESYDVSDLRSYFEVMPRYRDSEGNITSTDDRGPYTIYPETVDDLVATYDYNSADAPASFNTVTGSSIFSSYASTFQDRLNFGVFMKDRMPYIYFLFDNAQEDRNFRLGGDAALTITQQPQGNGYNPIVFYEDQEEVGDNALIDYKDSLAYYADEGVLKTAFKWEPEANDGMIYGPVLGNVTIDLDSSSLNNRYGLFGYLDTYDGTFRVHKTRTDSEDNTELFFELKQSGAAVLVNDSGDGEDIVASSTSLNSPANGSNFLDFYNESTIDVATTRTYTFDPVALTSGDEKLLSFAYYAKHLSYIDTLLVQVSYNETPEWDNPDKEFYLEESGSGWTNFRFTIPASASSIALRIVSKTDEEADIVSFDQFRVVQLYDEVAPTLAITSDASDPQSGAFTATFTFSEDVTGFDVNDISVGNGEASNFNNTSASVYTATITPDSDGEVTVDVAANSAIDWNDNDNTTATQLSVTNDETAPTVTITSSADPTSGAFTATFTFSEDVRDFIVDDITVGNGAASNFNTTSASVYTATITPSAEGAVTVDVAADKAQDAAGNDNTAATQLSITNDETAPGRVSGSIVGKTYGLGENMDITITFDEEVIVETSNGTPSINIAMGGKTRSATYFSGSATKTLTFRYTTVAGDFDGNGISLSAIETNGGSMADAAGNEVRLTGTFTGAADVRVDTVIPGLSITSSADPTSGAFAATFTFSEDVTGFTVVDISVGNGAASNFQTTSASVYTATITPVAEGTVTVDVAADAAEDAGANGNTAATQLSVTNDETAPDAPTIGAVGNDNGASDADFITNDQSLLIGGNAEANSTVEVFIDNASIGTTTTNAQTTWLLDYTGTDLAQGTHSITAKATDDAGNTSAASSAQSLEIDLTAPTVTITSANTSGVMLGEVDITITFSESVSDFDETGITVSNGSVKTGTFSGSETTYSATISGTDQGEVTVDVFANKASDLAGNANTAATQFSIENDVISPSIVITSDASDPQSGAFTATFTWDEDVKGFTIDDIDVGNGAAGNFDDTNAPVYTATITPAADGEVTVDVDFNAATDAAGNVSNAATQLSVTNDETAPTVTITSDASDPQSGAFTATFTFSEDVNNFVVDDITVGNGAAGNFNITSASIYTATITPSSDGEVTVDVAANAAQDDAGKDNTAATQLSLTNDETAPSRVSGAIEGKTYGLDQNMDITVTFDEAVIVETSNGTPSIDIAMGGKTKAATYLSGSGTKTLTFRYTTVAGDSDVNGVTISNFQTNGGSMADAAGNAIPLTGTFSGGADVRVDTKSPYIIISTNATNPHSGAFTATFTFSEAVTGFTIDDIQVGNGAASDFSTTSASVYTALITPSQEGAVTVDVGADVAEDAGANKNTAATQLSITNDETAPTVTITSNATDPQSGAFTATFTFSEGMVGFAEADITVGNGAASNFNTSSASIYTATITPTTDGQVTVDVDAGVAQDNAGNDNTAATQLSLTNDETTPTLVSATKDSDTQITLTFDEPVKAAGTNPTDFTVTDGNSTGFIVQSISDGTAEDEELILNFTDLSSAQISLEITYSNNHGEVTDLAGNELGSTRGGVTISLNAVPTATNVDFSGTLTVGETLTGIYDYADSDNDTESGTTFQWYRSDDATGTGKAAISGATAQTYDLTSDDVDKYISFEVTPNDGINSGTAVESDLQGPVSKISQTITFNALADKTYGDDDFDLTATASSSLEVTYVSSNTSVATVNGNTVTIVGAGNATITASQAGDASYAAATDANQELTVNKATLTATADDKSKTYGEDNPTFTISYSGFVNGEDETAIDAEPTASTVADAATGVGTYDIALAGGSDDNYSLITDNGSLTISKATLTATADDKSKVYGDVNPDFTITYSGFVNGDDETAIDTEPTASTVADATTGVGTYDIALVGGTAGNYSFNLNSGTLTIGKATLIATADDKSKTYGDDNPDFTVTYSGFVNGDDETTIDTEPAASTVADATTGVGTYDIALAGGTADNYSFSLNNGTLTIGQASLTATADDKSKTYGDANPDFTITYSGFVNGDDETTIDTEPTASTVADATTGVGTYDITLSGGTSDNYSFNLNTGTLTISQATLTATADDKNKTYGDDNPDLTITYSGFVNGDDETTIDTEPTASTVADATTGVGTYDIALAGGSANNYSLITDNGTLTISQATLTATAEDKSKIYGDDNPDFTVTYSGFVNGDNETAIDTEPTASTVADATTGVGTYDITLAGGTADNYSFSLNNGTLTIGQASLTATADDKSKTYGNANPDFTVSYSGFVNGDDESVIGTEPTASTTADETSNVGIYSIALAGGSADNYSLITENGSLTINKATLTATADDKSKTYGDDNPDFTVSYLGFVNGDDETVLNTEPVASTSADNLSDAGTYDIVVSDGSADNYSLNRNSGILTISKAIVTAVADDQTRVKGQANPEFTIAYSGFVNGEDESVLDVLPVASTTADETTDAGTVVITLTGGSDNNYAFNLVDGELTILDASFISSVTGPADGAYGIGDNLDFELTFSLPVTISGTPGVDMTIGTQTRTAVLTGSVNAGTTATFRYTIQEDDQDADGVLLGASVSLNGATIKDQFDVDAILNLNGVADFSEVLVDGVKPQATLSSAASNLVNGAFSTVIEYDEEVTGVTIEDITVTNGTASNFEPITPGEKWSVDITPATDGVVTVSLAANTANDLAGNSSQAATDLTRTFDGTAPEVSSITRADDDQLPTGTTSANFTVTFSEDVTGVDAADFETVTTGSAAASVNSVVAIDAKIYTVNVNGIGGEGTIGLNAKNDGSIQDAAGNSLASTFTGDVYTTNFAPTDISISAASISENNAVGAEVGALSSTDTDEGDIHSYSLISGEGDTDNGSFQIDGTTLLASESFDFEAKSSYSIRVQTNDGKGATFEKSLTITIDNVGEAAILLDGDLNFEPSALGVSTTRTFTVTNVGEISVEVRIISLPAGFTASPASLILAVDEVATMSVVFTPTEAREYNGNLLLEYEGGEDSLPVSGEGNIVTGIDNGQIRAEAILIHPNPASKILTVDLSELNIAGGLDIQMINGTGNAVFELANFKRDSLRLDVSEYKSGMYIMQFTNGRSIVRKKVIIRK